MNSSRLIKLVLSAIVTVCFLALTFSSAQALERIRWKMQSAWGAQVMILGPTGKHIEKTVSAISDGKIQFRFHEPINTILYHQELPNHGLKKKQLIQ